MTGGPRVASTRRGQDWARAIDSIPVLLPFLAAAPEEPGAVRFKRSAIFRFVIRITVTHLRSVNLRSTTLGLKALVVLSFLTSEYGVGAETNNTASAPGRPKVALVLSGGAARGSAH